MKAPSYFRVLALIASSLLGGAVHHANAAEFRVTNTSDSDGTCTSQNCSVREAIKAANAAPTDDTIIPSTTGPANRSINLSNGELVVKNNGALSIELPDFQVSGEKKSRIFHIEPGARFNLRNITLVNGSAKGAAGGGALWNEGGTVALRTCLLFDSAAEQNGGSIYSSGGSLKLEACSFTRNETAASGGAVALQGGTLIAERSLLSFNRAARRGAGLNIVNGTVQLLSSIVSSNIATAADSTDGGGALHISGGSLLLDSSSVTHNNTTLAEAKTRGGLYITGGTVTVKNSLIARNSLGGELRDFAVAAPGTVVNGGFNLVGNNETVTAVLPAGALTGTNAVPLNPRISAPTSSYVPFLLGGSPALDAANSQLPLAQNFVRVQDLPGVPNAAGGNGSDIGAFEAPALPQSGPTFVVNSLGADSGGCSVESCNLMQAVTAANDDYAISGRVCVIDFDTKGLFATRQTLEWRPLQLRGNLTINGPEVGVNVQKIPYYASWTVEFGASVRISDFNFLGGPGPTNYGGAILNQGLLEMNRCTLSGFGSNSLGYSPALTSSGRRLTMRNCTLTGNRDGAIGGGQLSLDSCT
ncbi:hypothetical protein EON80_18205, partial [bacterium]